MPDRSVLNGPRDMSAAKTEAEAAQKPARPERQPMGPHLQLGIGIYLTALGLALMAVTPWAWSFASRLTGTTADATVSVRFLGMKFTPTAQFSLLLIVILTAMLGSVAVLALTFSSRAGHGTLQRGYLWWYLTRPITAAGLGVLLYMAIMAGFFNATTTNDRPALVIAAAIGGLAGLFTDQVLKKMRSALALLPTNENASDKADDAKT